MPEFLEGFHKLLAEHQNALRGRWENFWVAYTSRSSGSPKLRDAAPDELGDWRLVGHGVGIHWPKLDEDTSVRGRR